MPRQRKQHQNQRPTRRKQFQSSGSGEKFKPGFPMNIFQKSNWFWAVGLVAMVGSVVVAAFAVTATQDTNPVFDDQTPTSTIAVTGTVEATPTVTRQQFSAAEQVLVPTSTYTGVIATAKGDIEIEFFADVAPGTVNSFLFLTQEGYFDGQIFHRVDDPDFVIQAGDPNGINGDGLDGPGYSTNDEPNELRNERGIISMAKVGGQSSFGSQFFINVTDNRSLDFDSGRADHYYPFARVTAGMDVVDSIEVGDLIESITWVETPDPNAPTPTATVAPTGTTTATATP